MIWSRSYINMKSFIACWWSDFYSKIGIPPVFLWRLPIWGSCLQIDHIIASSVPKQSASASTCASTWFTHIMTLSCWTSCSTCRGTIVGGDNAGKPNESSGSTPMAWIWECPKWFNLCRFCGGEHHIDLIIRVHLFAMPALTEMHKNWQKLKWTGIILIDHRDARPKCALRMLYCIRNSDSRIWFSESWGGWGLIHKPDTRWWYNDFNSLENIWRLRLLKETRIYKTVMGYWEHCAEVLKLTTMI